MENRSPDPLGIWSIEIDPAFSSSTRSTTHSTPPRCQRLSPADARSNIRPKDGQPHAPGFRPTRTAKPPWASPSIRCVAPIAASVTIRSPKLLPPSLAARISRAGWPVDYFGLPRTASKASSSRRAPSAVSCRYFKKSMVSCPVVLRVENAVKPRNASPIMLAASQWRLGSFA